MPTQTANEQFQDALIRHQTYLLRYSGWVRNRMNNILAKTEEDLVDKIRSRLANNIGLNTSVELNRLDNLMRSISTLRGKAWDEATELLEDEMVKLAQHEPVSITDSLKITMPVQIDTVLPSANLLRSIALSRPFQGRILKDWASSLEAEDLRQIQNAIQLGMTAGEDMSTIARRVVGTGALQGEDGVTALSRRQVQAITRTAVMHVSNASRTAFFLENSDIVTEEYFVATLDSRTTPICRAYDGKTFELGKGPIPPLHFNCRSLRIAAIDGTLLGDRPAKPYVESELLDEFAAENDLEDAYGSRDDLPYGSKGAYDKFRSNRIRQLIGPVPASTTYQIWMERQSTAFQNDTLGITKAKLFRAGLQLDRYVDRNGNELTLHELVQREAEYFRAAGLNPDNY